VSLRSVPWATGQLRRVVLALTSGWSVNYCQAVGEAARFQEQNALRHRIEFRTAGRQMQERQVGRSEKSARAMPTGAEQIDRARAIPPQGPPRWSAKPGYEGFEAPSPAPARLASRHRKTLPNHQARPLISGSRKRKSLCQVAAPQRPRP